MLAIDAAVTTDKSAPDMRIGSRIGPNSDIFIRPDGDKCQVSLQKGFVTCRRIEPIRLNTESRRLLPSSLCF
eukprot:14767767-Ditylum_brightwellii.AAC.1